MKKINSIRGMHDVIGDEYQKQKHVTDTFVDLLESHNYMPISTPMLEYSEVFKRTLGEETDVVMKEMYTFKDKSDDLITLRPEGTASVARAIISNGLTQSLPLKLYYFGSMFRYERPQKGRYREFNQVGMELYGNGNIYEDWEAIFLAYKLLKKLNIEDKFYLRINTLGSHEERLKYVNEIKKYFVSNMEKLSVDSKIRLKKNPLRILDSKAPEDIYIKKYAPKIYDFLKKEDLNAFISLKEILVSNNIKFYQDPFLVRGLDYYNGVTFEFTHKENKNFTVLAGGRYNNLVKELGGKHLPAVGWAAGSERLVSFCDINLSIKKPVVIAPLDKKYLRLCLSILNELIKKKLKVEISYFFNLKKSLSYSNKIKASHIIIIGENEANDLKPSIKNLKTGTQTSTEINKLSRYIKNES